jgi:LysM repeat protein
MSSNPFGNSSGTAGTATEQQLKSRERVKITFYGVIGILVVFCLASLFQGCKTRRSTAELPPAEALTGLHEEPAATSTIHSSEPVQESVAVKSEVLPPAPMPATVASPAIVTAQTPVTAATAVVAPTTAPQPTEQIYTVKKGDSLTRIAKANHTTIAALKQANGLTSDNIVVGRKLKIPTHS